MYYVTALVQPVCHVLSPEPMRPAPHLIRSRVSSATATAIATLSIHHARPHPPHRTPARQHARRVTPDSRRPHGLGRRTPSPWRQPRLPPRSNPPPSSRPPARRAHSQRGRVDGQSAAGGGGGVVMHRGLVREQHQQLVVVQGGRRSGRRSSSRRGRAELVFPRLASSRPGEPCATALSGAQRHASSALTRAGASCAGPCGACCCCGSICYSRCRRRRGCWLVPQL